MNAANGLNIQIESMIGYIREFAPEVYVRFNPAIYEDEHANIDILPPLSWDDERCLDLQEALGGHVVDIHVDTGYLIGVYVYTREQQISEARRKREDAERVLTEAETLGLLEPAIR